MAEVDMSDDNATMAALRGILAQGFDHAETQYTTDGLQVGALMLRRNLWKIGDVIREVAGALKDQEPEEIIIAAIEKAFPDWSEAVQTEMEIVQTYVEDKAEEGKDVLVSLEETVCVIGKLPDEIAMLSRIFVQAIISMFVQSVESMLDQQIASVHFLMLLYMCSRHVEEAEILRVGKAFGVAHLAKNCRIPTPVMGNEDSNYDEATGMTVLMGCIGSDKKFCKWLCPLFDKFNDAEIECDLLDLSTMLLDEPAASDTFLALQNALHVNIPDGRTRMIDAICSRFPAEMLIMTPLEDLDKPLRTDQEKNFDRLMRRLHPNEDDEDEDGIPCYWSWLIEDNIIDTLAEEQEEIERDQCMMVAKSVGRPLSHELNVYPIAGERLFLAVGRVALAYLGTELEFASSSALDCLSTRLCDAIKAKGTEVDLTTVSAMVCVGFERLSEFRDAVKTLFRKETSDMLQLLKEKLQKAVNGSTNVIQVEALLACGAVHANCLATEKWDPSWAGPIHALLTVRQDHGGPTRIAECAERHVNLLKKLGARFPGTILRETIDPLPTFADAHKRLIAACMMCGLEIDDSYALEVMHKQQRFAHDGDVDVKNTTPFVLGVVFDLMRRKGLYLDAIDVAKARLGSANPIISAFKIFNNPHQNKIVHSVVLAARHYGADPNPVKAMRPSTATFLEINGMLTERVLSARVDVDAIGYHKNNRKKMTSCTALCLAAAFANVQSVRLLLKAGASINPDVWAGPLTCAVSSTQLFPCASHITSQWYGDRQEVILELLRAGATYVNLTLCQEHGNSNNQSGVHPGGMKMILDFFENENPLWSSKKMRLLTPLQRAVVLTVALCSNQIGSLRKLPRLPTEMWLLILEHLHLSHIGPQPTSMET